MAVWPYVTSALTQIVVNFIVASFLIMGRIIQFIVLGTLRQTEIDVCIFPD